ncbi:predicted protein [Naegleria gruberi]|uniref:Predicted protein n=1 Tax=Naegleria gruberi TaxID=5762 RepID=D2V2M1_NAEGR|nr:uncharacterized protein NAEGRDRAFT_63046 [Naegleria gruberi]EFC48922.1 predicted protein [Naegleria gruberi]|eukprot:XP_002681666.1 predicted protein [Naegleria gruberi strain NEG-M]
MLDDARNKEEQSKVIMRNPSPKKSLFSPPPIYAQDKFKEPPTSLRNQLPEETPRNYILEDFKKSFKVPPRTPLADTQHFILNKYKNIHRSKFSENHDTLTNDMLNAAETVSRVLEQCDPDDEKYNIRILLEELNRLDIQQKKRKSLVPMNPISYTKKENKKNMESTTRENLEYSSYSPANRNLESFSSFSMKRPGSAPSCRQHSVASVPVSVSRTLISNNSQYLSSVMPSKCVNNFVANRPSSASRPSSAKRPSSVAHVRYLTEGRVPPTDIWDCEEEKNAKEQQLNEMLYDLVCEYHYLKEKGKEETEKEKKEYQEMKINFQRIYPLIKKHFQTYFASRKEIKWNDQKVIQLNKDIEDIALEEQIRDRVEQEHMDFLTKKLKVNQIRKSFKAQRQHNFLKRVVVNDPRALSQLQRLCTDESLDEALNEEVEDWENADYYDMNDYGRPSFEIPKIDLTKTKKKSVDLTSVGGQTARVGTPTITTNDRNAHLKYMRLMTPEATQTLRNSATPDASTYRPSSRPLSLKRPSSSQKQRTPPGFEELDKRTEISMKNPLNEIHDFEKRMVEAKKKNSKW